MSLNIGESTGRPPSAAFIRKPRVHTLDEIGTLVSSGHELPARGNRSSVTVPTHAALARRSTVRRASQGLSWVPAVGSGDKLKDPPASGTASVVTGRSLCLSDEQSKQHDLREPKSPAATTDNDSELGTPLPCPEIVVNYEQSPWQTFTRLGELVQGKQRHIVCIRKHIMRETYMFKASNLSLTKAELLKSLTHPNLLSIRHVFIHNHIVYVGMVYTRHTLEEILHVHLSLEESHIQAIAQSMFEAISYIGLQGLVHGNINLGSIRICGRTMKLVLTDWELHSHIDNLKVSPNKDFEQLGLVLIECMDGKLRSQDNTVAGAKRLRAANKVYGLNTAEKWSGCKQLIDLLDDMFSTERTPLAKMNKRHIYLCGESPNVAIFEPYLELVSLECYTLWHAAEADQ